MTYPPPSRIQTNSGLLFLDKHFSCATLLRFLCRIYIVPAVCRMFLGILCYLVCMYLPLRFLCLTFTTICTGVWAYLIASAFPRSFFGISLWLCQHILFFLFFFKKKAMNQPQLRCSRLYQVNIETTQNTRLCTRILKIILEWPSALTGRRNERSRKIGATPGSTCGTFPIKAFWLPLLPSFLYRSFLLLFLSVEIQHC